MTIGYAAFQTNLNINVKGNIIERSRTIKNWNSKSNEDFHTEFYKQNIITATFLDTNKVPDNAIESWDISIDKDKGVMAYVTPNKTETNKYDLFIGANRGVIANEDSSYLFYNFRNLTSIDFKQNFDTSNATLMNNMFAFCTNLTTLDLSNFDTSNVTNMRNMFQMYDNSVSLVIENKLSKIIFGEKWSTTNLIYMAQMFVGLENITELNVSNWDTSKVIDMQSVFAYCRKLTTIDLSKWNTTKATDMSFLFMAAESLTNLDLSNFNTNNVTNMRNMFHNCTNLKTLNLCTFNTSKVTNMYEMFRDTPNLTKIKVGSNWTTVNANITNMFKNSRISTVTTGEC